MLAWPNRLLSVASLVVCVFCALVALDVYADLMCLCIYIVLSFHVFMFYLQGLGKNAYVMVY